MAGTTDLALMGSDELEEHLAEHRKELFNLRFQLATGQLDNTARMGQVRREIARTLTLLREREILEAEGELEAPAPRDDGDDEIATAGSEEEGHVVDEEVEAR